MGGGPQIENLLTRVGKKGEFVQGMRVTDAETMEIVEMVLGGQVNKDVVNLINQAGGKAVGLNRQGRQPDSREKKLLLHNRDNYADLIDIGMVGDITQVDPALISHLEAGAFIPVIAPIGVGEQGETYNINADVVAGKIAEILKAEKLVLLTNTPGVLDKDGKLVTDVTPKQIDALVEDRDAVRRHAAENQLGPRSGAQGRQERAHHRRPRRTCAAARDPDQSMALAR